MGMIESQQLDFIVLIDFLEDSDLILRINEILHRRVGMNVPTYAYS